MKTRMLIGIILIVIGIASLVCQGITYATREKFIDIGTIQLITGKTKTLSPIVGGIALVSGIVLLVAGRKQS
ncbi:MAG: DUF3185 domain-containing protein [Spirochaetota bacterium]